MAVIDDTYIEGMYEIDRNQYQSITGRSFLGWLKSPVCIILFIFIFGAMVFKGLGQQQILGILLIFAFALATTMHGFKIIYSLPLEIKMFIGWVIWATLTGPIVAADKVLLWHGGLRQTLQILAMVIAVYGIAHAYKESALKAVMFGIIAGGILQALVTKGAVQVGGGSLSGLESETERAQGLTDNANVLGFYMIWTMLAAFMFWKQKQGKTHIFVLAGTFSLIPILCYVMLASGSRKSLVAFAFALVMWFWYAIAPRKRIKAITWKIVVIAVIIVASGPASVYVLNNTLAGKRMMERLSGGSTIVTAEQTRYDMYIEGFKMFFKHPILGVGINQYQHYSKFGKYSHSNYMEPLATTGILGFILYQGIFFIPLFRAWRLTKIVDDPTSIYQLKTIVVFCVTIVLLGLGSPWYTSSTVMSFLALFSGYTYNYAQQVRREQQLCLEEPIYV